MKHILLPFLAVTHYSVLQAQKPSPISLEVNYGINGNFFVRSYDEINGPYAIRFYNKNFIGSIGGVEIKYKIGKVSSLGLAYSRSRNSKEISFYGQAIPVGISDFHISHVNSFYQLYYEQRFAKKWQGISCHAGLIYLRMSQQEVEIGDFVNGGAGFEERDYKNSKLEEAGVLLGLQYAGFIDKKFELGIKSRTYYIVSTGSFEAITLTPTLTYHF